MSSASNSINFDRAIEYYDQTRGFPSGIEQHIPPLFISAGNLTAESRVLEIGVGTGRIAVPLTTSKNDYTGIDAYTGIDISTGMMGKLREKDPERRIKLVQGDATQMPFASDMFDAVIAVHVFHLIPNWQAALSEVARVLKAGGRLLHGWNGSIHNTKLQSLWSLLSESPESRGDMSNDEHERFLTNAGWQPHGDIHTYTYTIEQTPQNYLDSVAKRLWSRTWRMTDEEITRAHNVLSAYVENYYDDPLKPIRQDSSFYVQGYLPPQTA